MINYITVFPVIVDRSTIFSHPTQPGLIFKHGLLFEHGLLFFQPPESMVFYIFNYGTSIATHCSVQPCNTGITQVP